jgi:hypothetical protein
MVESIAREREREIPDVTLTAFSFKTDKWLFLEFRLWLFDDQRKAVFKNMRPSNLDEEVSWDFGLSDNSMQIFDLPPELNERLELIDMNSWVFPTCRHSVMIHEIRRPVAFSETEFPTGRKVCCSDVKRWGSLPSGGASVMVDEVFSTIGIETKLPSTRKWFFFSHEVSFDIVFGHGALPCRGASIVVHVVLATFRIETTFPTLWERKFVRFEILGFVWHCQCI